MDFQNHLKIKYIKTGLVLEKPLEIMGSNLYLKSEFYELLKFIKFHLYEGLAGFRLKDKCFKYLNEYIFTASLGSIIQPTSI